MSTLSPMGTGVECPNLSPPSTTSIHDYGDGETTIVMGSANGCLVMSITSSGKRSGDGVVNDIRTKEVNGLLGSTLSSTGDGTGLSLQRRQTAEVNQGH